MPGFVDLQVNGFGGVDFNDISLTPEAVVHAAEALRTTGVTRFFVTLVTAAMPRLNLSLALIRRAIEDQPLLGAAILGVHLEGPFITPVTGPRGAHSRTHTRVPDEREFEQLQRTAGGCVRMITIAPELPGAIEFIARRVSEGVLMAIGHTNASRDDILRAVDAGATLSTHLGNGSHDRLRRHDNYVLDQLGEDRLSASFIADGHHLPPHVLRTMLRAKGIGRAILVTDATAAAGSHPGAYQVSGKRIIVGEDGDAARFPNGRMSGSSLRMDQAIDNVRAWCGLGRADAIDMASTLPARLVGLDRSLGGSQTEALLGVDDGRELRILACVPAGTARRSPD